MTEHEFNVACSLLEDYRRLIAAGKLQRWDVVKWTVGINIGLATVAAAVSTAAGHILVFAIIVAVIGLLLVLHYFSRMTNARRDAGKAEDYLIQNGIDLPSMRMAPGRKVTIFYDWQELAPFILAIIVSVTPAVLVFIYKGQPTNSFLAMSTEAIWTIIGAIASVSVLGLYIFVEFIRPRMRRYKLKHPCDVTFVIPPQRTSQICEFAVLDDQWHFTREITAPPHSDIHIELRLVPRLNFTQSEFAFGCDGDKNLDTKPFAVEYFNSFIDKGKKVASPESNEHHYTDRHQYYHITGNRQRSVGQHFIVGLVVRTREPGTYKADIETTTEEMQGMHRLVIRVEQPQKTPMKCVEHNNCNVRPNAKAT